MDTFNYFKLNELKQKNRFKSYWKYSIIKNVSYYYNMLVVYTLHSVLKIVQKHTGILGSVLCNIYVACIDIILYNTTTSDIPKSQNNNFIYSLMRLLFYLLTVEEERLLSDAFTRR